jgi:putative transposase
MQIRYRYRIEPTAAQHQMLARVFGCCRVVFNDSLRVREQAHAGPGSNCPTVRFSAE